MKGLSGRYQGRAPRRRGSRGHSTARPRAAQSGDRRVWRRRPATNRAARQAFPAAPELRRSPAASVRACQRARSQPSTSRGRRARPCRDLSFSGPLGFRRLQATFHHHDVTAQPDPPPPGRANLYPAPAQDVAEPSPIRSRPLEQTRQPAPVSRYMPDWSAGTRQRDGTWLPQPQPATRHRRLVPPNPCAPSPETEGEEARP